MKDVMIDLETMGTRQTSMIVQIGACYFDRETGEIGDTFQRNVLHGNDNFTVDQSTINWWLKRSDGARESVAKEEENSMMHEVLADLNDFLPKEKEDRSNAINLWAHATFDIPILVNAYERYGMKFPVNHRSHRDIRTLVDVSNHLVSWNQREGIHHDALSDCRFQVKYCVEALNNLKNLKK